MRGIIKITDLSQNRQIEKIEIDTNIAASQLGRLPECEENVANFKYELFSVHHAEVEKSIAKFYFRNQVIIDPFFNPFSNNPMKFSKHQTVTVLDTISNRPAGTGEVIGCNTNARTYTLKFKYFESEKIEEIEVPEHRIISNADIVNSMLRNQ